MLEACLRHDVRGSRLRQLLPLTLALSPRARGEGIGLRPANWGLRLFPREQRRSAELDKVGQAG
jgi:hypothetical protein